MKQILDLEKQCAIYTKKSTEEGLEQQFNSLDNQRLAGENYVLSQASEGWEVVEKHYDDGGYTPFGYDCVDKGLKINEFEAKTVRYIFDKFLELKSITATLKDLKQAGIGTRAGNSYSKKTLRKFMEKPHLQGICEAQGYSI
jgi:DNA invertase Pin-like site-specific DNA recombinase